MAKRKTFTDVWSFIDQSSDDACWEWQGHTNNGGYGSMTVKQVTYSAHRLAYALANPNSITFAAPKDKKLKEFVLHKCDNRLCCNPNHLFLGNYDDNNKDAKAKGRSNSCKGAQHKKAKLTQDQAEQARLFCGHGWSYVEVGKMFGIHANNISKICKYKSYIGATHV
jgi:hypothetical protein